MVKKLLTYITGEISIKAIGFLLIPLYSHLITPEQYGVLGFLNALVSFLPFILTFYYLYGYVRFSLETQPKEILSTFITMGLGLNLFFMVASIGVYFTALRHYYTIEWVYFLLAISASASLFAFQILQMHHRSQQMATHYLRLSLLYTITTALLNITFLVLLKDKIFALLLSGLLTNLLASFIAVFFLRKTLSLTSISTKLSLNVLRYTVPLVPGAISLLLYSQADKLILFHYVSSTELGIYTMAFTIGLSMSYFGSALFMSYQPLFYTYAAKNSVENSVEGFKKSLFILFGGLILVLCVIKIAYLLIDSRYAEGEIYAMIIAIAYSMISFAQLLELHLTYLQKGGIVSLVYSIGGILNIILLYFFIQRLGGFGASLALLISSSTIAFLMYFLGQKYYYLPYNRKILSLYFSSIVILIGGIFVIT